MYKIPTERMHRFGRSFTLYSCLPHWLGPIVIGDLGSKVKVTVTQYPFLLQNSLLTSLLYISVLLRLIKLKFGMLLRYALCRFVFDFQENQMGDGVMMTSFKFSLYKCPYFKFY